MKTVRAVVVVAGLAGWLYSWYYFRGVQAEFAGGDIGIMPRWLLIFLGLTTTALIGTVVAAAMSIRWWPVLSVAGSLSLVGGVVLSQHAAMSSALSALSGAGEEAPGVPLSAAVNAVLRTRPAIELILISAVVTILLLAIVTTWILPGTPDTPTPPSLRGRADTPTPPSPHPREDG